MANRHRGEIEAVLDGRTWTLCLTLGALADLESSFQANDLQALTARFSSGSLSALDMLKVIHAGLKGAGHLVEFDEVAAMQSEDGVMGFARIVTELLQATFTPDG